MVRRKGGGLALARQNESCALIYCTVHASTAVGRAAAVSDQGCVEMLPHTTTRSIYMRRMLLASTAVHDASGDAVQRTCAAVTHLV